MKNVLKSLSVGIAAAFLAVPTNGEIMIIKKMVDIEKIVEEALEETKAKDIFVAFDIDMTLSQPCHAATYYPALKKYYKMYKAIMESLPENKRELPIMLTVNLPQRLVEKDIPNVIEAFKEKGIKTIAFTASLTGKIDKSPRFEVVRYQNLRILGLTFEESFKNFEDMTLTHCTAHRGNYPVFYRGVLCANGEKGKTSKGAVLVAFLKRTLLSPRVIIMVDDKRKNLEDIEIFLKAYDPTIKFIGIEYQGAIDFMPEDISTEDFTRFWQELADRALSMDASPS